MLKLTNNFKIFLIRYYHTLKTNKVPIHRQIHNFAHHKLLGKYLFLTNTISSGVLMAIGDGIQQQFEFYKKIHKGDSYNWKRTINMALVGLAFGPVQHFFYKYIDVILPKRTLKSVAKKILLDQFIASPTAICIFFYGLGLLEDGNFQVSHKELKDKFLTIYMMDWMVWPPTQYINFAYLSPKYRVVYINFVTMLYDVFLSYVKYENKAFHYSQFVSLPNWSGKYYSRHFAHRPEVLAPLPLKSVSLGWANPSKAEVVYHAKCVFKFSKVRFVVLSTIMCQFVLLWLLKIC